MQVDAFLGTDPEIKVGEASLVAIDVVSTSGRRRLDGDGACDLYAMAGAHSCGDRISWKQRAEGGGLTETAARDFVAAENPDECGACAATAQPSPSPSPPPPPAPAQPTTSPPPPSPSSLDLCVACDCATFNATASILALAELYDVPPQPITLNATTLNATCGGSTITARRSLHAGSGNELLKLPAVAGPLVAGELARTNTLLHASSHGACSAALEEHAGGAPGVAPSTLLFNHKTRLLEAGALAPEDELLRANVLHTIALHPGATVVFDDDASCAQLLASAGAGEELLHWFAHSERMPARAVPLPAHVPYYAGKYRSDLCRLAQLYVHGGMYVDTDLQLVRSLAPLRANRLTTALGETGDHIFQALVVSEPQSPSLRRSIGYWDEWARGERAVQALVGPDLLLTAIADEERASPTTPGGRAALRAAGVEILLEARGTAFAREQSQCLASAGVYRAFESNCGLTVQAEASGATFAYSRMVRAAAAAAADGSRSCASAEPPVTWSCSCDHPFHIRQNGFTCVAGDGAPTRRQTRCAPDAVCGRHGAWEADLELVAPCVEIPALRKRRRRLTGAGNRISVHVEVPAGPPYAQMMAGLSSVGLPDCPLLSAGECEAGDSNATKPLPPSLLP